MLSWLRDVLRRLFGGGEQTPRTDVPPAHYAPTSPADRDCDPAWQREWVATYGAERVHASTSEPLEAEGTDTPPHYAYALRDDFLSPAEANFFRVLQHSLAENLLVFAKVRLADLVYAPKQDAQFGAWQKINRKHVDFVLCDAASLRPRLVIELDDRSHRRPDRIARDAFVDGVFAEVGLPILRVPAGYAYSPTQLAATIEAALHAADRRELKDGGASTATDPGEHSPTCERCGGEMRRRTAARGKRSGAQFWGCVNYPHCRSIVPIHSAQAAVAD